MKRSIRHDYRVNYGNGQISEIFSSLDKARGAMVMSGPGCFVERYEAGSADDPGRWVAWFRYGQPGRVDYRTGRNIF